MTDNTHNPNEATGYKVSTDDGCKVSTTPEETSLKRLRNLSRGRKKGTKPVSDYEKGQIAAMYVAGNSLGFIAKVLDRNYTTVLNNIAAIKESQPLLAAGKMVSEAAPLAALRVVETIADKDHPDSYKASKDLLKGVGIYRDQTDVSVHQVSDEQINATIADKILQALTVQAVDVIVVESTSLPTTINDNDSDDTPNLPHKSMGDSIRAENERREQRKTNGHTGQ